MLPKHHRPTDPLAGRQGKAALFKKHQRVKFLQDNVIAFEDFVWGEGEILATYHCWPGVDVDRYREGERWNVLISLRKTNSAGDIADIYIVQTIKGGFSQDEE